MEKLITHALARASKDPDKAEAVLAFFCDAVESDRVPDARILEHVAKAFRAILDGEEPKAALCLTRVKGQRKGRTLQRIDERHFDLAFAVARRMKEGEKRNDAFLIVADEKGASRADVKRAHETFGHIAKSLA